MMVIITVVIIDGCFVEICVWCEGHSISINLIWNGEFIVLKCYLRSSVQCPFFVHCSVSQFIFANLKYPFEKGAFFIKMILIIPIGRRSPFDNQSVRQLTLSIMELSNKGFLIKCLVPSIAKQCRSSDNKVHLKWETQTILYSLFFVWYMIYYINQSQCNQLNNLQ